MIRIVFSFMPGSASTARDLRAEPISPSRRDSPPKERGKVAENGATLEAPRGTAPASGVDIVGRPDERGWKGRIVDLLGHVGAWAPRPPVSPAPDAAPPAEPAESSVDGERLARFLGAELRLPLAALARLGARCAAAGDPDLSAVGRALARETERLDVLVANTLELGLLGEEELDRSHVDVAEIVEKVVAGHRVLVEGLSIRVRVVDATRAARVKGDGPALLRGLSALFSDLLERVPRRGTILLRVRDLLGFVRVDCTARSATPPSRPDRTSVLRANELVRRHGGELWEVADGEEHGFGLTLERPARERESARAVRSAPRPLISGA
jgi:hypothetical protein